MAETMNGAFLCAELSSNPKGSDKGPSVPEDIGKDTAKLLLEEIYKVITECFYPFVFQTWTNTVSFFE